jgi:hypothetical protein
MILSLYLQFEIILFKIYLKYISSSFMHLKFLRLMYLKAFFTGIITGKWHLKLDKNKKIFFL